MAFVGAALASLSLAACLAAPPRSATLPAAGSTCRPTLAQLTPPREFADFMLGGVGYPTGVTPPPREIALAGINWYGDDALWVILPRRGEVRGLSEKIPSWRLRPGTIEVGGRRVDAPSSLTPSGSVPGATATAASKRPASRSLPPAAGR